MLLTPGVISGQGGWINADIRQDEAQTPTQDINILRLAAGSACNVSRAVWRRGSWLPNSNTVGILMMERS